MNGFIVVDVGMCPILFLRQWVVDAQLLGHYPNVVDVVLIVVVATLYVLDVIANVASGDASPNGYVHAIAIFGVVDLDVDCFATLDLVDVLFVVNCLVVAVYCATLSVVVVAVVVDVFHPFSSFDVLNPFHPFDVWNLFYPFDVVDIHFGANLLGLAHLDDLVVIDVGFPYDVA